MKPSFKTLILGLFVSVVTLLPISQAYCQSPPPPAVIISIAEFDEQLNDVKYILTASGFPEMNFMAAAMIKGYAKGVDGKKPAGVLLFFNEDSDEPDFLGLVPVSNIDDILDIISNTSQAEIEEGDDFTTIIPPAGPEIFVKESEGYAFFSNKQSMIEDQAGSPKELIGELSSKYNLSAQIFSQRIPEKLRNNVLQMIRDSSEQTFDSLGESDLPAQLQRQNFQIQMKQMEMMFKQTDRLMIGMSADKDTKSLYVDIIYTGLPGSELAEKLAKSKSDQPTRFSGFLMDGAAFTQNGTSHIQKEDADETSKMMDEVLETIISEMDQDGDLTEEELEFVKKSFGSLVEIAQETLAEGTLDTGAVLLLNEGDVNFAAGVRVADPRKVEKIVKELAAMAEQKLGSELEVNLNSGSHKDVTFHQFVVQIPDDQDDVRNILGDQFTLVVGIGKKEVYLAAGTNPIATLKRAMDGNHPVENIGQFNLYLAPILKFAASVKSNPATESMAELFNESGNDRIRMTSALIENGTHMRFEMQDGVLGLIKAGFNAFNEMNGQGFPGANDDF